MDSTETTALLVAVRQGDRASLDKLITRHRAYLKRVVDLRLDRALRGRIDPSDVVQETHLAATQRIDDYLRRQPTSFRLWLRGQAIQSLVDQRRRHLRAEKRSVSLECSLSDASSRYLARHVLSGCPSARMRRKELAMQIRGIVDELNESDREIVLLRFVEELSNVEVAELLGIEPEAARKRHGRALRRLFEKMVERGFSNTK